LQIMRDGGQNLHPLAKAVAHALLHQVEGGKRGAHLARAGLGDRLGVDGERETLRGGGRRRSGTVVSRAAHSESSALASTISSR
jgi:hypothetical protein